MKEIPYMIIIKLKEFIKKGKQNMKMYILVNKNLQMSTGKIAGQVGHAVGRYYKELLTTREESKIEDYEDSGEIKIILKCPQSRLEELEKEGYITVRDAGKTEIESNSITCVNYGIEDENSIPKWLKRLRLL